MRPAFAFFFGSAAITALVLSCREPTAIVLEVSTDVDCATVAKQKVLIKIGSRAAIENGSAQVTEATTCDASGNVGTLTVVPSGDDSTPVVIALTLGTAGPSTSCTPGTASCIFSSRSLSYVTHTSLHLPIKLSKSCIGVVCGTSETCVAGRCVSDGVQSCPNDVCDEGSLGPPDAGVLDASIADASLDGTIQPDAPFDAPAADAALTNCNGIFVDLTTSLPNCGACGFDCTGGACKSGVCQLATSGTGDLAGEIAVDANRVGWTAGTGAVRSVPKKGSAVPASAFTPNGGTVYGIAYGDTVAAFRFGFNFQGAVSVYNWPATAPVVLFGGGTGECREMIDDAGNVVWFDATATSLRRNGSETLATGLVPGSHIAQTKSYYLVSTGSVVASVPKANGGSTNKLTPNCTYVAGDPNAETAFVTCPSLNQIKKAANVPVDNFLSLVNTLSPTRIHFDSGKKRLIWVSNDSAILESDANGGSQTVDLAQSQGLTKLGDLAADDKAVYFLVNGMPWKVARK